MIKMAESMSNLENTIRNRKGIHIVLRKKLLNAYLSEHGMTEIPRLLEENTRFVNVDLLPELRKLAENEDYIA
jgi:ribosomal protein L10